MTMRNKFLVCIVQFCGLRYEEKMLPLRTNLEKRDYLRMGGVIWE